MLGYMEFINIKSGDFLKPTTFLILILLNKAGVYLKFKKKNIVEQAAPTAGVAARHGVGKKEYQPRRVDVKRIVKLFKSPGWRRGEVYSYGYAGIALAGRWTSEKKRKN